MRSLGSARAVFARELVAYFTSPVAYVVGVGFLVLQGFSFAALVDVLANPAVAAPPGAVLRAHFGGTLLYWAILLAVIALLTMRLGAEERRAGTWELLYTAGASELGIVAGKAAAAFVFYLLLWLPTVLYLPVLDHFAPAGAAVDLGPVAGAYLGVALTGAALIALGLAASFATDKQVVAAVITFAVAMLGLLVGETTDLGGRLGPLAARHHMGELAAGLVRAETVVLYVGGAAAFLAAAHAGAAIGRRSAFEVGRRWIIAVAVGLSAVAAGVVVARLDARADLTRARQHSLDADTEAALAAVRRSVDVLVVRPAEPGFAEVFVSVDAALERIAERQPLIRIRDLDPAEVGGDQVGALAAEFAIGPDQLREGGAVVVQSAGRRQLLEFTAMVELTPDALGAFSLESLRAESAFARAIREVTGDRRPTVCFTSASGEIGLTSAGPDGLDYTRLAERLAGSGAIARDIGAADEASLAPCSAAVVAGPTVPLSAEAATALDRYLAAGGSLLVAVRSQPPLGALRPPASTGLELVLGARGAVFVAEIAVDPEREFGIPLWWAATDSYADHAITAQFRSRRTTVWPAPRVVSIEGGASIVRGSERSWGERDLEAIFSGAAVAAGEGETLGRASVAAAAELAEGGRLVLLGSAEVASTQLAERGFGSGHILAARAIRWLAGDEVDVPLADKAPEQLRLIMTAGGRRAVFVFAVILLPLGWGLFGVALLLWRRRG